MGRLRDQAGFTLIEAATVVLILVVLVAVVVPAYFGFTGSSQRAKAKANVRSALPAAEAMSGTTGSYAGVSGSTLRTTAPGIGAHVKAVAVNSNLGYCIQDTENRGSTFYNYVGGTPGLALKSGYGRATIQSGSCLKAVGIVAS